MKWGVLIAHEAQLERLQKQLLLLGLVNARMVSGNFQRLFQGDDMGAAFEFAGAEDFLSGRNNREVGEADDVRLVDRELRIGIPDQGRFSSI